MRGEGAWRLCVGGWWAMELGLTPNNPGVWARVESSVDFSIGSGVEREGQEWIIDYRL